VVKPYLNEKGELSAYMLDPGTEQQVETAVEHTENSSHLNLAPQKIREILDRMAVRVGSIDAPVVALCGSGSRYFLRQIAENSLHNLTVISHNEVPPGTKVVSLGNIG
jgi:flagellar biosynthesis protein FlhA